MNGPERVRSRVRTCIEALRPIAALSVALALASLGCKDSTDGGKRTSKASTPRTVAEDPVQPLRQRTYSIAVDGPLVFAGTTAGVVAWDFSKEKEPELLTSVVLAGSVQRLSKLPAPSTLLAAATGPTGLAFVDVREVNAKKMALVNEHPWKAEARGGCHTAWHYVAGGEGFGYVGCGAAGVGRFKHENAAKPTIDVVAPVRGYVRDLAVLDAAAGMPEGSASSDRVVAAAGQRGVTVVDFGGGRPAVVSEIDVGGEARALAVVNGHAYVAAGEAGLVIVDVRNPELSIAGRILPKTTDMARGIAVSGNHALLCFGESGLVVVDIADPTHPKELGRFDPDRAVNRVTPYGGKLYAANDSDGVTILDMANPQAPTLIFPSKAEAQ